MTTVNVINGDEVNEKTFYFTKIPKDEPALLRLSLDSGGWLGASSG